MAEERKSELEVVSQQAAYGGFITVYRHASTSTKTPMTFTVYTPGSASESSPVPVVYYLAGLESTNKNCLFRCGASAAQRTGLAMVCPDTSPRGAGIKGEDDSWDFGTGAGFYIDATEPAWKENYNMYTYVTRELPELLARELPALDTSSASICGHSMGGHGALTLALKNPTKYRCVSAFAPICHPTACPWGIKAFTGYLGTDEATWEDHDATLLMQRSSSDEVRGLSILIDQGTNDKFLKAKQLQPEAFLGACKAVGHEKVKVRMQEGYDHSYYFVGSFLYEHLSFAAQHLKPKLAEAEAASA